MTKKKVKNINTLYLLIKIQEFNTIKFIMDNIFGCFFFVGFGMSILYSLQIESSRKSSNFIYSVVCKYKMTFKLKIKVTILIN